MKSLIHFLNETLNSSAGFEHCLKHLKNVFGNDILSVHINSSVQKVNTNKKQLEIITSKHLDKNILEHVLNLLNYELAKGPENISTDRLTCQYKYIINPNISTDVSTEIHSEKYLYHITFKTYADRIERKGLNPRANQKQTYDYNKLYVFTEQKHLLWKMQSFYHFQTIIKKNKFNLTQLKHIDMSPVVLTIDVAKLPHKIKFFVDQNYEGAKAYYTFEPIPARAIIKSQTLNEFSENYKTMHTTSS